MSGCYWPEAFFCWLSDHCFGFQILVLATEITGTVGSYHGLAPWVPTTAWLCGLVLQVLGQLIQLFWPMC